MKTFAKCSKQFKYNRTRITKKGEYKMMFCLRSLVCVFCCAVIAFILALLGAFVHQSYLAILGG